MAMSSVGPCGFDLAPTIILTLTATPHPRPHRLLAGKLRETSTRCIRDWCCVRHIGRQAPRCPPCVPWAALGREWLEPSSLGKHWQLWAPCRLDEDGKVLTPEELLYRVSRLVGRTGLLGWQLGALE